MAKPLPAGLVAAWQAQARQGNPVKGPAPAPLRPMAPAQAAAPTKRRKPAAAPAQAAAAPAQAAAPTKRRKPAAAPAQAAAAPPALPTLHADPTLAALQVTMAAAGAASQPQGMVKPDWRGTVQIGAWHCTLSIPPYVFGSGGNAAINVRPPYAKSYGFAGEERIAIDMPVKSLTSDIALTKVQAWVDAHPQALVPCPKCGGPAWNRKLFPCQYRNDNCEDCWQTAHAIKCAALDAEMRAEDAKLDATHKAKGNTHKVVAWVHPKRDGDDYQIVMYATSEVTEAEVHAVLRRKGSAVLTDWQQTAL